MGTSTTTKTTPLPTEYTVLARIINEGYGSGAWHGPDLRAALLDVDPQLAFWRPAPERHNIAEVALHHAFYVRSVIEQLGGGLADPFPLEGSDWFEVATEKTISWAEITALVERLQGQLASLIDDLGSGRIPSPLAQAERLNLVLGITCHAVYHAGQVQLVKVLGRRGP